MTRLKSHILAVGLMAGLSTPAWAEFTFDADEATQAHVEANLLGIFYHELGHALIDVLNLPIFGQEEDAADVLSVFLIDALYEEDSAVDLARTGLSLLGDGDVVEELIEEYRRQDLELLRLQVEYGMQEGAEKMRQKYSMDQ